MSDLKTIGEKMRIRVTFDEEMLGTTSFDPELHETYIASKAPDAPSKEEEIKAVGVGDMIERGMTGFPRENGKPFVWDYQFRGMLKDACGLLRRVPGTECSKMKNYKKIIDGMIFVHPRKIELQLPDGETVGDCQRPLRASTPMGERVAIAHSETVPAGTSCELTIHMYDPKLKNLVLECFDYGADHGFGQWRNSGKGTFHYEVLEK